MVGGGEGGRSTPRVERMSLLVLAMIVGAMVPAAMVVLAASRDPLPRDCRSGQATATSIEGALLYTNGSDLWYSEGYPGKPRLLVDLAPPRPRRGSAPPSPGTASPVPSAVATPSAVPTASATASATPAPTLSRVIAADISVDRKQVAFAVVDAPGRPGKVTLMLLSPLDPPGTAPVAPWAGDWDHAATARPRVRILSTGEVLLDSPLLAASVPSPSPVPAAPSPGAPSASPTAASSPGASAATSALPRPSPSPAAAAPGSPGRAVVLVAPSPVQIDAQGPEPFFFARGLSGWPAARGYAAPRLLPRLGARVDGPGGRVAGLVTREVGSPLSSRRVSVVSLGTAGNPTTHPLCTAPAGLAPIGFSPEGNELVLSDGRESLLLDTRGALGAGRLLTGTVLAWR